MEPQRSVRRIISTSLPLCFTDATPPRPDPGHTATTAGGALKRMGYKPPPRNRQYKRLFAKFVYRWCKQHLQPLTDTDIMTVPEWLESTDYSSARKTELLELWTRNQKQPNRKVLQKVKMFIKDETYPEYKYPRLINSRVDIAKCLFGPLVAAVSSRVFSLPQFIKTVPVNQRPQVLIDNLLLEGEDYEATDYTSYEAHFDEHTMAITQKILFKHMVSTCGPEMKSRAKLFLSTVSGINRIVGKLISFNIRATRCSGEMDTSLDNGFTNAMNIEFLAWLNGCSVKYFVEGDDGIARYYPPEKAPKEQQFKDLGYLIKIVKSKDLSDLSFCGQVFDVDEKIVVTDVSEQCYRLGWTNSRYVCANHDTLKQLLKARGYSLCYQYNGCPILGVLGRRILELTHDVTIENRIIDNYDLYHKKLLTEALKNVPEAISPGPNTRLLVERLYGVPVEQQLEIEQRISTMQLGAQTLGLPHPPVWKEYLDKYSSTVLDTDPCWLLKPEHEYMSYIKTFANCGDKLKV